MKTLDSNSTVEEVSKQIPIGGERRTHLDNIDWDELNYLSNESIDFAFTEAIKGLEVVEKGREKIEKKTEFFLTYLMLCIAGLAIMSPVVNVFNGTWILINSIIGGCVALSLFVPNSGWFHYYATPRFLIENLHTLEDSLEQDLRLIKQRHLQALEIAFKAHNEKVTFQGKALRRLIFATIVVNLIFLFSFYIVNIGVALYTYSH
jgi:hypothetical protein